MMSDANWSGVRWKVKLCVWDRKSLASRALWQRQGTQPMRIGSKTQLFRQASAGEMPHSSRRVLCRGDVVLVRWTRRIVVGMSRRRKALVQIMRSLRDGKDVNSFIHDLALGMDPLYTRYSYRCANL
jgi:hypothetical protein